MKKAPLSPKNCGECDFFDLFKAGVGVCLARKKGEGYLLVHKDNFCGQGERYDKFRKENTESKKIT